MAPSHSLFSELENLRLKNGPCLLEGGPPVLCGSALLPALALLCPHTPHWVPPLPSVPSTSSSPQSPSDLKLTVTALPPLTPAQSCGVTFLISPFLLCIVIESSGITMDHDHKDKVT